MPGYPGKYNNAGPATWATANHSGNPHREDGGSVLSGNVGVNCRGSWSKGPITATLGVMVNDSPRVPRKERELRSRRSVSQAGPNVGQILVRGPMPRAAWLPTLTGESVRGSPRPV